MYMHTVAMMTESCPSLSGWFTRFRIRVGSRFASDMSRWHAKMIRTRNELAHVQSCRSARRRYVAKFRRRRIEPVSARYDDMDWERFGDRITAALDRNGMEIETYACASLSFR